MQRLILLSAVLVLCAATTQTMAASTAYTISTFKNGQPIGTRKVNAVELRNAAIAMTSAFKDKIPSYDLLVSVAKGMTAKDRCFNLYSSRVALASVEGGILDASANAEGFLKNSIVSIEEVNSKTQVTCEMRFPANYSPIKDAEDASEMSIESSDLEADPAQTNVITLNALLRNRAPYTKAYPNLELTLTDAQDKTLARTTFRPVEYLKPNEDEKQGLAANHDLSVKLSIDTTDLKPSGYRLFLFYPKKHDGLQPQPSLYAEKIKLFRPQMAPLITPP